MPSDEEAVDVAPRWPQSGPGAIAGGAGVQAQAARGPAAPTNELVVDLDGTLIRTDLLHEAANRFVTRNAWQSLRLIVWLASGRAAFRYSLRQRRPRPTAR